MSLYFVAGDDHEKHGFIPVACDWAGRTRINFSSPFGGGLYAVTASPGGPFSIVYVSEADLTGFTVTVVDKDGKPDEFAVGELSYRAIGWSKEDEERWPRYGLDALAAIRLSRQSGEQTEEPSAPTATKTDNMSEENMEMGNGGADSVLTKEKFEEIKAWFGSWDEEANPRTWALIHEIERLHPEWSLKRYEVVRVVDRKSRTECFAEFGPDCIVREMQK